MIISRSHAWCVWLTASFFYAYQNVLRVMPNIMLNDLMQQFHVDAGMFGQLSGVYYVFYSLAHVPVGLMLDRYGPKKVLPACIVMAVVGLTPILFADHWGHAVLGRILLGIGSSAGILGTFKIIRMTFSEDKFSKMLGFSAFIGFMGSIYGGGPISYLCQLWGYKAIVELAALIGLGFAVWTYVVMPKIDPHVQDSAMADVKAVFTNRRVMFLCLSAGLMVGPIEGFADVWGAAYLKKMYGLDVTMASTMTSIIFTGMCVGAPFISYVVDATKSALGVIMSSGVVMIVCFVLLLMGVYNMQGLTVSFFVIGLCSAYQVVVMYKVSTYVPENIVGLATAVANMLIMSFGYAFHSGIGYIVHTFGGTESSLAFTYGISFIPAMLTVGVLGCLSLIRMNR